VSGGQPQSILAHLEELRWRLLRIAIAIVVGGAIAFVFADQLRSVLEHPFEVAAPSSTFQVLDPGEQFGVLMRIGLFGGVVLASPVILFQAWAFINPALTFIGGVAVGYWTLPRGLQFLLGIFPDVSNDLRIGSYYSFTLRYLLAFGLAFLYPVFLFAAAAVGAISSSQLARGRRWALMIIVIAAALITPSGDAFTLLVLSVPLYLMYEATYWLIRLLLKK
jgi:sec-independent protein translocase protein TatC